ncbi:transcription elongation factor Spt5 [Pyrolobus fumarii]|uniref:transcription elongation factor Spt5 n=1 Tax=Pyrolobus fumarii TaxID=54252 RepID=UPI001FCC21CA|nr:transcription elongation factor Spt5 [Pyrolobus fumarii]
MTEETKERGPQRPVRFYAVRTIAGREIDVALLIESRARENNLDIRSIIVPPKVKGIVLVEAPAAFIVSEAIRGIRYARSVAPGYIPPEEIAKVMKEEVAIRIKEGDVVEIISGPFRGFRGRVERADLEKGQIELTLLDASYNLRIIVSPDMVRPVREETHGA